MNSLIPIIALVGISQNIGRKLSETVSDTCTRWGVIASIACPELIQGDIRTACASCPSIVNSVQTACYSGFPGLLCAGDCDNIPTQIISCESVDCQTCWATQSSGCENCHSSCFTHTHCYDDETQTFSTPTAISRNSIINNCIEMKQAYTSNNCCSSSNGIFHNSSLYLKINL